MLIVSCVDAEVCLACIALRCVALPDTEEEEEEEVERLSELPSASFHQWHGAGGGEARRQAGEVHGQREVSSA